MAFGTNIRNLQRSWRGTSSRTFFVYPAITIVFEVAIRRRLKIYAPGLLLMLLGYLQYRLCGAYLMKRGQGSGYGAFSWRFGPSREEPRQAPAVLLTAGPYTFTRNPMYLGHVICMAGLTLALRSPLALLLSVYHGRWLHQRALADEESLAARFGEEYASYRERVPRWLPGLPALRKRVV